ncbi:MAG TPA: tyrosine-type recombinase/integrase [Bryobacteraceae bacterium]|nr:tyrosine-type recombinase/integrase [Bryobacteraceae bacterium]
MLERLFDEVEVRHALRRGPMGPYLDSIATQLLDLGYCRSQARKLVQTASSFGLWLAERGTALIDAGKAEIKAFIAAQRRTAAGRLPDGAVGCTRLPDLLQSTGLLCNEPERFEYPIVKRFEEHLEHVRGVQRATRIEYCRYIHALVGGIGTEGEPAWWNMTSEYISDFVLREVPKTRAGRHRVISSVRTFLRFMVCEGLVPVELINAIPRVQRWRYAELPKHLSADELEAVLKACQSSEHASLRDRAFITLLARLGVRAGELRALALEDIEWTEGLIHIRTSKTGRGRTLPLPRDAGELLAQYIRTERSTSTPYREAFLTSTTPHRPIGDCTASNFVKVFLGRLGLDGPGRGPHSFRHTAATQMVQNGASLKQVADVLGHRSLATTAIYIKLDQPSLREVAMPWTGGNV